MLNGFNNKRVQNFEGEVRYGLAFPLKSIVGYSKSSGAQLGMELRYNFKPQPFDVGLAFGYTETAYSCNVKDFHDYTRDIISIQALTDYNFKRGSYFNPFVGIGLGAAIMGDSNIVTINYSPDGDYATVSCEDKTFKSPAFTFRCGVELLYHIRISAQLMVTGHGYSNFGVSLGGVIGGRPKKSK